MRRMALGTMLLATCCLIAATPVQAETRIIYVDANAPGLNNGSSWVNAYRFLQDALADARSAEKPMEIRVAQGVYKPDRGAGQKLGDRLASFDLFSGVALQGGYAGLGTPDPNARDTKLYKTILSGDLAGNDAQVNDPCDLDRLDPTRSDNSYHVIAVVNASSAHLEGLTITGGRADLSKRDEYATTLQGGGVYAVHSDGLVFENCSFFDNYAGSGGACNIADANVTMKDCTITGNASLSGGGLSVGGGMTLSRCEISHNYARASGGGISAGGSESVFKTIVDCALRGNVAGYSGGAVALSYGKIDFIRCSLRNNRADLGGGVAISAGTQWETYRFDGCHFSNNSAATAGGAMAIYSYGAVDLTNCILSGNAAAEGGAVCTYSVGRLRTVNCTVSENRASRGRFAFLDSRYLATLGPVVITNSIIVESGNAIYTEDMSVSLSYSMLSGGLDSIIDPNSNVAWGLGNIVADPCFAAPSRWDPNGTPNDPNDDYFVEGDYHLKSQAGRWDPNRRDWVMDNVTSPCIDAGDPNAYWSAEPWPNGGWIDMGAYGGTAEASKSLSVVGNPDDPNNTAAQGPVRIRLGKGVSWAGEPNAFDANLPGYHVVGEIASLTMRARIDKLPTKLVLAIQTSPGMAPMLENFTFAAPCLRIGGEPFGGAGLACSTRANSTLPWQDAPGVDPKSYFTFAIVDGGVRVIFQPKAVELLRTECSVSWIDWYRR
jgi:hypothetical protein